MPIPVQQPLNVPQVAPPLEEPLTDAQNRVISRLQNQHGILAAHGVGTGKTRLSIEAYKKLGLPTDVVVPAALKGNYQKELDKWVGGQPDNLNIESQQGASRSGLKYDNPGGFMVVDEAHRGREYSSQLFKALKQNQASKILLLSGSPVYNKPSDISPLVNLVAGKTVLPENPRAFADRYVQQQPVNPGILARLAGVRPGVEERLNNVPELRKILNQYVDYQPGGTTDFPTSKEETVNVPMVQQQTDLYNTIMDKAPLWVRWKVKAGLPPDKREIQKMQAFLSGARQVSDSTNAFVSDPNKAVAPKVSAAANYLKQQIMNNPRYKAVVYSNYLQSGLQPYSNQLKKFNIPYGEFSGDISPAIRNQMVKDYNANKLKALLISSAGAEGLDLKGTRLVQLLEPHFNEEKEKQIIGRAIRYKSHAGLPDDEQNVTVQRYFAQPGGGWLDKLMGRDTVKGTDEYIYNLAQRKARLNNELLNILKEQRNGTS